MADALHDLGCPLPDRVLVLNVLRGLNSTYDHLRTWITRQRTFPSFLQVRDDLVLKEITRVPATGSSSSSSSTALVTAPPASSASPATSLLGAPPTDQPGGGGPELGVVVGGRGDVEAVVLVALLLVVLVPVVVLVGAVGARRLRLQLPLLPLALEVRPDHPSANHGQGASQCGCSRVRGALAHSSNRRPCSPVLLPCSRRPGLHPLSPASHRPGLGVGAGHASAVLQHHGTDTASQHRVDRRLGCLLPHHP